MSCLEKAENNPHLNWRKQYSQFCFLCSTQKMLGHSTNKKMIYVALCYFVRNKMRLISHFVMSPPQANLLQADLCLLASAGLRIVPAQGVSKATAW